MRPLSAAGALWLGAGGAWIAYFLLMLARSMRRPVPGPAGPRLRYVILVPCRDEELVLARTLAAVTRLDADRVEVIVIDDGSQDRTADIARAYPEARLVTRSAPDAGRGKGAALNAGLATIAAEEPDDTVVVVMDADGRIGPEALCVVDRAMASPDVGAVQLSVRIGNRHRLLGRFQDVEFVSFSHIMQAARDRTGTVGLGGNGQFVRLGVLRQLGPRPWSDCLTEDLDLGLRIAALGWRIQLAPGASVSQQGVGDIPALIRQRSRWLQGHLQCWGHLRTIRRSGRPRAATADLLAYLMAPVALVVIGVTWGAGLVSYAIAATGYGAPLPTGQALAGTAARVFLTLIPCACLAVTYRRRSGDYGLVRSTAICGGLLVYNLVWLAAMVSAFWSCLGGRSEWSKTARLPEAESPSEREYPPRAVSCPSRWRRAS